MNVELKFDDMDRHGAGCECGLCNANGKSYGCGIYQEGDDEVMKTVYAPSETAVEKKAKRLMEERGWKESSELLADIRIKMDEVLAYENEVKKDIISEIRSWPGNPRTTKLSDYPRCFTISFSDLQGNWSPKFHCFEAQHEDLIELVKRSRLENIQSNLEMAYKEKRVRTSNPTQRIYLHPDVLTRLEKLLWKKY